MNMTFGFQNTTRFLTIALCCATAVRAHQTAAVRQMYGGTMRPSVVVETLEHSDLLFPARVIQHGPDVHPLPLGKESLANVGFEVKEKKYDLFDYMALNRIAGLLILKNGAVVREDYELGTGPKTHWPSFSMAKSVTSTLVGQPCSTVRYQVSTIRLRSM